MLVKCNWMVRKNQEFWQGSRLEKLILGKNLLWIRDKKYFLILVLNIMGSRGKNFQKLSGIWKKLTVMKGEKIFLLGRRRRFGILQYACSGRKCS